ncbi:MAG: polymerase, sigma-24 subunit, subfamily [Frankiales bacterium]|nr:polymerase, sigma-24 subunit, subfamily [Frankiales bacterium]
MATFSAAECINGDVAIADDERDSFLAHVYPRLFRSALLLTGQQTAAEDLVQEAMVVVLVKWRQVRRADSPEAYVRRVMTNAYLAQFRRRSRHEMPSAPEDLPESRSDDHSVRYSARDAVMMLLGELPPRQRAAVVLRHYDRYSEAETAQLLGCSLGTVKSLTSRGLAALRELAHEEEL